MAGREWWCTRWRGSIADLTVLGPCPAVLLGPLQPGTGYNMNVKIDFGQLRLGTAGHNAHSLSIVGTVIYTGPGARECNADREPRRASNFLETTFRIVSTFTFAK